VLLVLRVFSAPLQLQLDGTADCILVGTSGGTLQLEPLFALYTTGEHAEGDANLAQEGVVEAVVAEYVQQDVCVHWVLWEKEGYRFIKDGIEILVFHVGLILSVCYREHHEGIAEMVSILGRKIPGFHDHNIEDAKRSRLVNGGGRTRTGGRSRSSISSSIGYAGWWWWW